MKTLSKLTQRNVVFVAAIACLVVAGSLSAFAVPPNQVARVLSGRSFTAACCVPIGPTVRVTEPATVVPVIVTWSTDYVIQSETVFQLSVNGGPCQFKGAGIAPFLAINGGSGFLNSSFHWAVLPADGLVQGTNTFTVCAGSNGDVKPISLGFGVLSVQIGK